MRRSHPSWRVARCRARSSWSTMDRQRPRGPGCGHDDRRHIHVGLRDIATDIDRPCSDIPTPALTGCGRIVSAALYSTSDSVDSSTYKMDLQDVPSGRRQPWCARYSTPSIPSKSESCVHRADKRCYCHGLHGPRYVHKARVALEPRDLPNLLAGEFGGVNHVELWLSGPSGRSHRSGFLSGRCTNLGVREDIPPGHD